MTAKSGANQYQTRWGSARYSTPDGHHAAVAANIASVGSEATAIADQDSIIIQDLDGVAIATAEQDATIQQ